MNPGKALIGAGLLITLVGVLFVLGDRLPFRLGRLPGDITINGKNSTFYFPLTTSLLISAVLSLLAWLVNRR